MTRIGKIMEFYEFQKRGDVFWVSLQDGLQLVFNCLAFSFLRGDLDYLLDLGKSLVKVIDLTVCLSQGQVQSEVCVVEFQEMDSSLLRLR